MKFYNLNDYDTNGKIVKYSNAKDACMTKGANNISSFILKETVYNKLHLLSTYSNPAFGMLQIAPDGYTLYHADWVWGGSPTIIEYKFPAHDVSRAGWLNHAFCNKVWRHVAGNGTKIFGTGISGGGTPTVMEIYSWDWPFPQSNGQLLAPTSTLTIPEGGTACGECYNVKLSADGMHMYILMVAEGYMPYIKHFALSIPYAITTASYVGEYDAGTGLGIYGIPPDFSISADGLSLYVMGGDMSMTIYQCSLSTAYTISTTGGAVYSLPVGGGMEASWSPTRFTIDPLYRRLWTSGMGTTGYNLGCYEQ